VSGLELGAAGPDPATAGNILDRPSRTVLVQFLHDLADEINAGAVVARGFAIESQEGQSPVVLTGERQLKVRWYDPETRAVIR
jgi:hypothetical protein